MIQHWLHTIKQKALINENVLEGQIGHKLYNIEEQPYLEDYQLLFIFKNMPLNFHFRQAFDQLADHFSVKFLDLGHLKNQEIASITNLLKELGANHKLIFIGGTELEGEAICKTLKPKTYSQKHTYITDRLFPLESEHKTFIGLQRHLNDPTSLNELNDAKALSLGQIKNDVTQAEPFIRDAQHISFNLNVLDNSCFNKQNEKLCGLDIYEACSIMKLAGSSSSLRSLHIETRDMHAPEIGNLLATLSWYFLEGSEYAFGDDVHDETNQSYIVYLQSIDQDITFVQGSKSGKWWFKNPSINGLGDFIPCSYEDYQTACKDDLPAKLLNYF